MEEKTYLLSESDISDSIELEKPMHFTAEQTAWIKKFISINAIRQRADAIEECVKILAPLIRCKDCHVVCDWASEENCSCYLTEYVKEQMKGEQNEYNRDN